MSRYMGLYLCDIASYCFIDCLHAVDWPDCVVAPSDTFEVVEMVRGNGSSCNFQLIWERGCI